MIEVASVASRERRVRSREHLLRRSANQPLATLLLVYAIASFVHFLHNAEYLSAYPGLPPTWTRSGVYFAWALMTTVGMGGWMLIVHGFRRAGLLLVAIYASLGMDSLGHYAVAPLSAHTTMMNVTILLEVSAAAVVLMEAVRRLVLMFTHREPG